MRSLALGKAFTIALWLSILCACATSAWSQSCIAKSVVVVGAGMSGSTAAYNIMKKNPKCFKVRNAHIKRLSPSFKVKLHLFPFAFRRQDRECHSTVSTALPNAINQFRMFTSIQYLVSPRTHIHGELH